jgi:acyl-CoA synthetase (AMP-forming)/AMP-acid ligase II
MGHGLVNDVWVNAQRFRDKPAIICGPDRATLTYHDAGCRIDALATALREARGPAITSTAPRVGLLFPSGPDAILAYLACQLAGCVALPLNIRLVEGELEYILRDAGASLLMSRDGLLDAARSLGKRLNIEVIDAAQLATPTSFHWRGVEVDGDATMIIKYTSGTTGFPKGITATNDAMIRQYVRWSLLFGIQPDERLVTGGPLFHTSFGGLSLMSLMCGSTNIVLPRFDAKVVLRSLRSESTFAFLVPSMMTALIEAASLDSPENGDHQPRFILSSGSALPAETLTDIAKLFPQTTIAEAYGWSEAGWVTYEVKRQDTFRFQSVGWPLPGYEVVVQDESGAECPPGTTGEIAARSVDSAFAVPFPGYLNVPDTETDIWRSGFVRSGDAGVLDADGRLRVVDRVADMIVSGGENVYCAEVENAILSHPSVIEVAVIGRPDPQWGEAVVAVVVAREQTSPAELEQFCRTKLAGYKTPKEFVFVDALTRNPMGKVLKRAMRERLFPK